MSRFCNAGYAVPITLLEIIRGSADGIIALLNKVADTLSLSLSLCNESHVSAEHPFFLYHIGRIFLILNEDLNVRK